MELQSLAYPKDHQVIIVEVSGGRVYAVDITGAQFGWHERLCPWDTYQKHRVGGNVEYKPSGDRSTLELICGGAMDDPHGLNQVWHAIRQRVLKSMIASMQSWKDVQSPPVKDMATFLAKNGADFQSARDKLVSEAKAGLYQELAAVKAQGIGRFCPALNWPHLSLRGTRYEVVATEEEARKLDKVWLTEEEYQTRKGNVAALRLLWNKKAKAAA